MKEKQAPEPTWNFKDRYASDAEFKRQVDEGRKKRTEASSLSALQSSLDLTRGKGKKLY